MASAQSSTTGTVASLRPLEVVPSDDSDHLPDVILVAPGRITYDDDGHDAKGRHIFRERVH